MENHSNVRINCDDIVRRGMQTDPRFLDALGQPWKAPISPSRSTELHVPQLSTDCKD